ncbi:hypothetical protein AMS59_00590 [Lysinibacillus sp. FJAT-14745]|uniref:hypothetical protein n=1 Tax=Lysinibacillus sp. FJAT-14745 TaxID=1704289 RepID=UPI0006ABA7BC|nr:hypothetical protein [Lysinibacillus sp. FJAT-14745]KOP80980.1 hypothetical protein AMS59_00590 [Lysinibacillus sp. FJAT-14745]
MSSRLLAWYSRTNCIRIFTVGIWGFQTLADFTAPYIDFVMWENFSYDIVGEDEWSLKMIQQLVQTREKFGKQVMTIGFNDEQKSHALAEKYHFKFFYSPAGSYYNTWQ